MCCSCIADAEISAKELMLRVLDCSCFFILNQSLAYIPYWLIWFRAFLPLLITHELLVRF